MTAIEVYQGDKKLQCALTTYRNPSDVLEDSAPTTKTTFRFYEEEERRRSSSSPKHPLIEVETAGGTIAKIRTYKGSGYIISIPEGYHTLDKDLAPVFPFSLAWQRRF